MLGSFFYFSLLALNPLGVLVPEGSQEEGAEGLHQVIIRD
jgi:hypothetical protein